MGITVFSNIADIQTDKKTLSEISETGRYYRHPDSACVAYAELVKNPLGQLPVKDYKIAVVGGGAAGIVAIRELYRLTFSNNNSEGGKKGNISITLYEQDPDHFAATPPTTLDIDIKNKKAGRVFCARSGTNSVERKEGKIVVIDEKKEDYSVYEIGAMRFPAIAGLTWHYAKLVFEPNSELKPFPNPSKVRTEFVFGDRVDRYFGGEWLDPKSPTKKVFDYVREALFGPDKNSVTNVKESFYPIGVDAPRKITDELKDEKTSQKRLEKIQEQWQEFANKYDIISLGSAVKQVITKYVNDLDPVAGISDINGKINYYWELFGCFGFGTGGFKPLFNMSLVEMMRLILWDYSNEYLLPTDENVDFIRKIHEKSIANNSFQVKFKSARVCDVCHEGDGDKRAIVFSYDNSKPDGGPDLDYYDYVILAVPPQKLAAMASRVGFSNTARKIQFGDYGREYKDQIFARPPFILSEIHETPNVKIYNAINQVNMVHSSKVFGTIKREIYDKFAPNFTVKNEKGRVTAVVSDCGLGACYVIPMTLNNKLSRQLQLEKDVNYYSFLISYNWEDDTKRLQHHFQNYPINALDLKSNNPPELQYEQHEKMINSVINHLVRDVKYPKYRDDDRECKDLEYVYKRWWLGEIFGKKFSDKNIIDTLSYDWGTTSHTAGAFKLDPVGGYYNSNLCFRYHTHALNNKLNNRFFIAGDSYSHIGGWLEGAFMSAVNSVMGIIVAANGGGEKGLKALSKSACDAITSLEPVASEGKFVCNF